MQTETLNLDFKPRDFVHLHVHTDYSLLQSTIQLKPLVDQLKTSDFKACAITDYGNMYGAISFYNTMRAEGIHPVLGYEAYVASGSRFDRGVPVEAGERPYYPIILLAKDFQGYLNLISLASKAFTDGFHHKPRIDLDLLAEKSGSLIALSGGPEGACGHFLASGNFEKAKESAGIYSEIFGKDNFYLEIQDHDPEDQKSRNKELVKLSAATALPLVATNDVHYLSQDDARAQEVLMCIGDGKTIFDGTRTVFKSRNYYLRTAREMWDIFGSELPEALENTQEIARRCIVEIPMKDNLALPEFPIPLESLCATQDDYLDEVVRQGFEERRSSVWAPMMEKGTLKYSLEEYLERLATEIKTIVKMKFPGYFLIVWDFIKYAREQSIPVGPGRGSAAGSLVAYCLGITDVDPLQYDLLFERFLNAERVSMPDIDIDFCVRRRGDVIRHVTELYGQDSVCQIITFGTMASKAAIKDVGRALNMPYGDVEKIGKLIPPPVRGRNISITQAIEQVADLRRLIETDPQVAEVIDLARRIEGCARHSSVHAAGVVISPRPLHELIPIAVSGKDELTSQYSMNDLEKVGMLKMDFLALTTLTIISDCLNEIKRQSGEDIDWSTIPLDDERTMALFGEGRTEAIFQFESSGMQEICRRLKPTEIEDLAALNALYRPGPLDGGMVDDFIARHRGEKQVRYIIPEMKEILSNTYGILVYQEQIMQLAQKLAGYTLGDADMMRRAMGKKKRSDMAKHEKMFIEGSVDRGYDRKKAEEIYNLMAQFADYGFNKSHSVAYALLAYQTAYLKAHYPAYFYASVLSNESQDTSKIYKYSNELRSAGLELLPPDLNESGVGFTPLNNAVRFGLSAIKGIGAASVEAIIKARGEKGRFTSLFDVTTRLEQGTVNRRALESLVAAGALDSLMPDGTPVNEWRARLFGGVDSAVSFGQKIWGDKLRGQTGLFGHQEDEHGGDMESLLPDAPGWTPLELSNHEKDAVGFYLSNHPLDEYVGILRDLDIRNIADQEGFERGDRITIAGIVSGFQVRHSKKGNRFCSFRLDDQSNGVKCLGWSEVYSKYAEILKEDELLIVFGKVESREGLEVTLIVEEIRKLSEEIPRKARSLEIILPAEKLSEEYFEDIFRIVGSQKGSCQVELKFDLDGVVSVAIGSGPLRIQGSGAIEQELLEKGCRVEWHL